MANTDNPFGFKLLSPFNPNYVQFYPLVTAFATATFRQDLVGALGTPGGLVCGALGGDTRPSTRIVTAGAEGEIFGVVQATYDSDLLPSKYFVATTAGDAVVGGYLAVCTDPDALYLVQEDGVTTPVFGS